jgi:hypothetical protein
MKHGAHILGINLTSGLEQIKPRETYMELAGHSSFWMTESKSLYDWQFTADQFVSAPRPFRPATSRFLYFATEPLRS